MCELGNIKFIEDAKEAFEYWKSKQDPNKLQEITLERWLMLLLKPTIYDLIGEKRIGED